MKFLPARRLPAAAAGLLLALSSAVFAAAEPAGLIGIRLGVIGSDVAAVAVIPGSAAADAGIAAGDKLQAVDGQSIGAWTLTTIASRLRGAPGTAVTAVFQRGDAEPVEYRLVRRAAAPEESGPPPSGEAAPGMIGLRLGVVGSDVAVIGVVPGSPAAEAGLAAGDKLQSIEGRPVGPMTLAQIVSRLRGPAGSPVEAAFARGDSAPIDYRLVRRALAPPPDSSVEEPAPDSPDSTSAAPAPARPAARVTREEAEEELLP